MGNQPKLNHITTSWVVTQGVRCHLLKVLVVTKFFLTSLGAKAYLALYQQCWSAGASAICSKPCYFCCYLVYLQFFFCSELFHYFISCQLFHKLDQNIVLVGQEVDSIRCW